MKRIIAAGGIAFNHQLELLLIYRHGKWDLPKGHLEKGETLEQCALRETAEETGLTDLEIGLFVGITHHNYYDRWLTQEAIKEIHWFTMQTAGVNAFPQLNEGIEWIRWIPQSELNLFLTNTYDNIKEIVNKALSINKHTK